VPLPMRESIGSVGCCPSSREAKSRQLSDRLRVVQTACALPCLWVRSRSPWLRVVWSSNTPPLGGCAEVISLINEARPVRTFSASDAPTRQADVICDLPEPRELSCATEELRRHLVQLVEYGTFLRWPPIPPGNVDPSFSYSPGGASGPLGRNQRQEVRYRHVRQRASQ
jgi:hypothetical protein